MEPTLKTSWEEFGNSWEQNQGFSRDISGLFRSLPVKPKMAPDQALYPSGAIEAATGIEPVYRALQAPACHRILPGQGLAEGPARGAEARPRGDLPVNGGRAWSVTGRVSRGVHAVD